MFAKRVQNADVPQCACTASRLKRGVCQFSVWFLHLLRFERITFLNQWRLHARRCPEACDVLPHLVWQTDIWEHFCLLCDIHSGILICSWIRLGFLFGNLNEQVTQQARWDIYQIVWIYFDHPSGEGLLFWKGRQTFKVIGKTVCHPGITFKGDLSELFTATWLRYWQLKASYCREECHQRREVKNFHGRSW